LLVYLWKEGALGRADTTTKIIFRNASFFLGAPQKVTCSYKRSRVTIAFDQPLKYILSSNALLGTGDAITCPWKWWSFVGADDGVTRP
jgi:hypothetical protein